LDWTTLSASPLTVSTNDRARGALSTVIRVFSERKLANTVPVGVRATRLSSLAQTWAGKGLQLSGNARIGDMEAMGKRLDVRVWLDAVHIQMIRHIV
jgi:Tfp pilus assembly protein PilN